MTSKPLRADKFSQLILVIMLCSLSFKIFAFEKDTVQIETTDEFSTPLHLRTAQLASAEQVQTLLNAPAFLNELATIAKKIPANVVDEQPMFNKTALMSIREQHQALLHLIAEHKNAITYRHYTLYEQVVLSSKSTLTDHQFTQQLENSLTNLYGEMSDEALYQESAALGWSVENAENYVLNIFKEYHDKDKLTVDQAIHLIVNTQLYQVLKKVIPVANRLIDAQNKQRYDIQPAVLLKTPEGVELTATIVRKKHDLQKRPAALQFTIYADEASHIKTAIHAAAHGYIGVIANSRGKRLSSNTIVPWEYEGKDATAVIDWISKQSWSDGRVAMYGGSYNGFTQWAAAKYMHPALKTIVPYAAASPITGLPIENGIVLTANYEWAFYVTNNKTLDNSVYSDWQKSSNLRETLFTSGRATTDIDKIDGKDNPWFQKWLSHPSYDNYYQDMLPYQQDYAKINIPVLSITGYFDGGQISAINFLTQHYQYNKNANHSLLIGPYDHFTAQNIPRSHYSNYQLDEVALEKDTEEIAFAWFDHALFVKAKPRLVADKVNYQLMGTNTWQHTNSYQQLNEQAITFYLSTQADDNNQYLLTQTADKQQSSFRQTVDFADRTEQRNAKPWPAIQEQLNEPNGLVFITKPFEHDYQLAGAITGEISLAINKKEVDIGYNFYELSADGKVFSLNTYRSRASYAKDPSQRQLLTPHKKTTLPIVNARMIAKMIKKGSRLAIVLNVNKNHISQVNMGTGSDVNSESIKDAGEPLIIDWFNDSKINIPLKPWQE